MHVFLTSALVDSERSASRPGQLTPRERSPFNHCIGAWVGHTAGLVKNDANSSHRTRVTGNATYTKLNTETQWKCEHANCPESAEPNSCSRHNWLAYFCDDQARPPVVGFFLFGGGGRLSPLGMSAPVWPTVPAPDDYDDCEAVGGMSGRGNWSTRRKPASVPLCTPQIPQYLTRARTLAAVVGSQRLTD
jgi:hypothetical protein